jgi:hypothetical protein
MKHDGHSRRDDDIALLAVEQLGILAARLLSRTELSHSAHQVLPVKSLAAFAVLMRHVLERPKAALVQKEA